MYKHITIEPDLHKKFQAALVLTGEKEEEVVSRLMNQYADLAFESVMDNKSLPQAVEESPEEEQKKKFTNWFRSLTRNGKPYNPVTISGYTGRIENICSASAFNEIPVDNLFSVTEISEFLKLQKQIKNCAGYSDIDAKAHNGVTAALRKYEEFLRYQTSGVGYQNPTLVQKPYHVKPSGIHRWTFEEDRICCEKFLEYYVVKKSDMDTAQFIELLSKEVPDVTSGSLRMKVQNIKYLVNRAGFEDTSTLTWLSQCSMQCEKAFNQAVLELDI